MSRLVSSTAMTADGVIDVADWFVSEGAHDAASREQFVGAAGMFMVRKTYEGLAAYWQPEKGLLGAKSFDSGVTVLRYAPA